MRGYFTFVFVLLVIVSNGQQKGKDFLYSISFAECFKKDVVGLKLNGKMVIKARQVTSNPVLGITKLGAYQDSEAIWASDENFSEKQPPLTIADTLDLSIYLNGKWKTFTINLNRGKILFINHCAFGDSSSTESSLTIDQYKDKVLLD
jgi:hypothetical protein